MDNKIIEEMAKVIPEKIKDPLDNSRYIIFGKSLRREIARIYYNAGYRKLPKDSVVLSRKELNEEYVLIDTLIQCKEELEFIKRQKNKLETRIAIKENDIGKLESEIDDLKYELKQSHKETVEKYNDGVVEFIKNLFDIGQIDFKTKIELLKENEKILKQFGVEIKEL